MGIASIACAVTEDHVELAVTSPCGAPRPSQTCAAFWAALVLNH